jgi:dehydrogenase/reductase SDR family protein 7B
MDYFKHKNILITGATSGIGRALAQQLAKTQVTLLLVARNGELLQEIKQTCEQQGAKVMTYQIDLMKMDEVERLVKEVKSTFSQIDVLVNNAGISQRSQTEETSEQVDRQIMELNFFSPIKLTKLLWPLLTASPKANIVNISSVAGIFGFPQRSAYSASKHALAGFFESWMLENKQPQINFTAVFPGRILTNISYNALKSDGSKHELLDEGQAKGISAEACAAQIIKATAQCKQKVYIVNQERILLFLYRFFPSVFVYLVKKLDLK